MSSFWTVGRLGRAMSWDSSHGGKMVDYWLAADDGHDEKWCYTTRKADSPAPQTGEQIYGHIEVGTNRDGKEKLKLVKDQIPDDVSAPSGSSTGPPPAATTRPSASPQGRNSGGAPSYDARSARIERQHSQSVAVAFAALKQEQGGLSQNYGLAELRELIDWFAADVDRGEQLASQPELPTQTAPEPQHATKVRRLQGIASNFDEAQVRMRLVACGTTDTTDIDAAIAALDTEQAKRFELALENIAAQEAAGLDGEAPIPGPIPDTSDIPF